MIYLIGDANYLQDLTTNFVTNIQPVEGASYPSIQGVTTILPENEDIFEEPESCFAFAACGCTSPLDSYMYYYNIFRRKILSRYNLTNHTIMRLYSPMSAILSVLDAGYVLFSVPAFGAFLDALKEINTSAYQTIVTGLSYSDSQKNVYEPYSTKISLVSAEHPVLSSYYDISDYEVFYLTSLPIDKFTVDSDFSVYNCTVGTTYMFSTITEENNGIIVVNFDVRRPQHEIEVALLVNALRWLDGFVQMPE